MEPTPNKLTNPGREAESQACVYLEKHGLRLLEKNYRCAHGEIDLIMEQAETLVFIEVRYRRSNRFGAPAETVGARKQARLRFTAEHYLQQSKHHSHRPCRFDIVALTPAAAQLSGAYAVNWLQDAFQA